MLLAYSGESPLFNSIIYMSNNNLQQPAKQYSLLKDLPFADAGTVFTICDNYIEPI
jgi:hypothetical protein